MENEMRNVEKIKEKEYVHNKEHDYASKGLAGTALGLGIGGAALALWNSGILGCNGGGGCGCSRGSGPTSFEAWSKECEDAVALTNEIWRQRVATMESMRSAREVDVNEKFGLYKATRDLYDVLNERYAQKFCELDKKVYGMEVANMYQNKIIQMSMDNVLEKAYNRIDRKTCKALYGVVGLPSTPTVTVLEGANSNGCMCSGGGE